MNLYEKLQYVQIRLKAPKSQYNEFGRYNYRNCEDIQEAAKPIMDEVKAVLVVGDELVLIGERYYIKATARFIDCETGEFEANHAYAREELDKKGMDASQVTGSTSSYARKYALNGLFCLDDVKDADTQDNSAGQRSGRGKAGSGGNNRGKEKAPQPVNNEKISDAMKKSIISLVEEYQEKGVKMEKILKMYSIKDISDMSISQYKDCMEKLALYKKEDPKRE